MDQVLNAKDPLTEQQPKRIVFVEMFRAGPQISSTGQKMMFSEDDLDQVVNSYNPTTHEAPLIIGHDQEDGTPALGWGRGVWRKGKELWGKVELTPKAEKLIRDGVFKKVSSSFYLPDADTNPTPGALSLRHLGLVSIPAVKGLTAFSEITGDQTITFTSSEGESSISFKESLGNNLTMARKRTKETPVQQSIDHADGGGMTVNINIGAGGTKDGTTAPNVYDDGGNKISETGAPADYGMEYGGGMEDDMGMGMNPQTQENYVEGPDGKEMGDEDDGSAPMPPDGSGDPGADSSSSGPMGGAPAPGGANEAPAPSGGSGVESDDISGDVQGDDQAVSELASKYTEEQLIKALYQLTNSTSMMEGVSYNEFKGAVEEFMEEEATQYGEGDEDEEKKEETEYGEDDGEGDEDKEDEGVDHAEIASGGEDAKGSKKPPFEKVKAAKEPKGEKVTETTEHAEEECDDEDKEKKEKDYSEVATGTLDHSESAVGDRGRNNLQARVAELEEELARQKKAMREAEITSFCETVYSSGKLTPQIVRQGDLVRFMETLNAKNTVNFSEAGKTSQYDFFKGVLEAMPSMVSFEEVATPATALKKAKAPKPPVEGFVYDQSTAALHAQALEYQEKNSGTSYEFALRAILTD
jgi:hypothetical protein